MKHKKKHREDKESEKNSTYEPDESVLSIDLNELDREWSRQPKLYFEYANMLAKARRKLDEAEAELKVVKAEVDRDIRDAPKSYKLSEKPTEVSIASTIILQPRYKKAQDRVIQVQYLVNMLFGMTTSLDHKKSALENAVKLHGQNYFSTPVADQEGTRRINEQRSDKVSKMCQRKR